MSQFIFDRLVRILKHSIDTTKQLELLTVKTEDNIKQ